ncbi:hypothetical protein HK102_002748 [Quaeritorhiza haematococci]|nr:hypothetical protein HK102_002748 [Quaeritorhiza haematococci]
MEQYASSVPAISWTRFIAGGSGGDSSSRDTHDVIAPPTLRIQHQLRECISFRSWLSPDAGFHLKMHLMMQVNEHRYRHLSYPEKKALNGSKIVFVVRFTKDAFVDPYEISNLQFASFGNMSEGGIEVETMGQPDLEAPSFAEAAQANMLRIIVHNIPKFIESVLRPLLITTVQSATGTADHFDFAVTRLLSSEEKKAHDIINKVIGMKKERGDGSVQTDVQAFVVDVPVGMEDDRDLIAGTTFALTIGAAVCVVWGLAERMKWR